MPKELDLDAQIASLERAVAAGDQGAMVSHLETIEGRLATMNPLTRGMTYAHVKSVLGRPDEAVEVVEDLLHLVPDDGLIYYQLGCYRRAAEDLEGALVAFTRATELDPARADAWIHRGMLLDARGEPQSAIEAYRHAILRAPTELDAWRNLGNSLAAMALFDEALEAYRTASQLRADDPTLAFLMASAHKAKGDLSQANAGLPAALREELGEAVEVRHSGEGPDLRCRFHVTATRMGEYLAAASGLLRGVAQELDATPAPSFPLARSDSFVVRHAEVLLLCDVDAVRAGLPNRFFDATGVVERAVARSA